MEAANHFLECKNRATSTKAFIFLPMHDSQWDHEQEISTASNDKSSRAAM
jgi:hypothetical protein